MFKVAVLSLIVFTASLACGCSNASLEAQSPSIQGTLDSQVRQFLDGNRGRWRDLNVPASDGQALYDIVVKKGYRNALEIGTSTGHSGVWIAWALSKTGGRLTTIEIDQSRYKEALANFREAGVAAYIDARLGDAHSIVPALPGPFDFVFCDADKDWYKNYIEAVLPKLSAGGCFVAHNVSDRSRWSGGSNPDFLNFVRNLSYMETSFITSGSGMSISIKNR
jgi:caffeoyl-CoA O-methyltransferase